MSSVKTTLVEVTIATKTRGTASSSCRGGNREEKAALPKKMKGITGSVKELLQELRETVTAHDMTDLVEFVQESDMRRVAEVPPLLHNKLERNIELLKDDCMKLKHEAVRGRLENEEMVKQLMVEKDNVDNLESQIVNLKKIISSLTISNTELLGTVLENFDSLELISNLEHEESVLAEQVRKERSYSSELQCQLQAVDAEIAALKPLPVSQQGWRRGYPPCLSLVRSTPLAMAPSFHERQELVFHPVMLELAQTIADMEETQDRGDGRTRDHGDGRTQEQGDGKVQNHGDGRTRMEEVDARMQKYQSSQCKLNEDGLAWSDLSTSPLNILDCTNTTTETKFCLGLEKSLKITEYLTE